MRGAKECIALMGTFELRRLFNLMNNENIVFYQFFSELNPLIVSKAANLEAGSFKIKPTDISNSQGNKAQMVGAKQPQFQLSDKA